MSIATHHELAGQVALVTGAAINIGRAIAIELAKAGASVAVNTKSSREAAQAVVNNIRAAGGIAEMYLADITKAEDVKNMADAILQRFGRIDILVLNASIRREIQLKDMTYEQWREPIAISLDGSFHCIKACLPSMIANKGGNIIALTGSNVLTGSIGKTHSGAAKAGLTGMIKALAREVGPFGVRANCVSPGIINTSRPPHRSPRRDAKGIVPLERYGDSEEIASTVRFLCGAGAGYITGQTVHVNGGQWMF